MVNSLNLDLQVTVKQSDSEENVQIMIKKLHRESERSEYEYEENEGDNQLAKQQLMIRHKTTEYGRVHPSKKSVQIQTTEK